MDTASAFSSLYCSPVGDWTLSYSAAGLHALSFCPPSATPASSSIPAKNLPAAELPSAVAQVRRSAVAWLDAYFAGHPLPPLPPLAPQGTPFQLQVWQLLLQIPVGATLTYGALARRVAALQKRPQMSAQAVGQAVSRNPLPLFIPCHRVVAASSLGGYALGLTLTQVVQILPLNGNVQPAVLQVLQQRQDRGGIVLLIGVSKND